jgi:4-amino-4-deoxy-L-arabinose transferase-like glycosyltransferase
MPRENTMKRTLLAVIIILGVVFRIWVSQPTWMNGDENYYINIFQNYVDRGELTPYMWRLGGDTTIIAGSGTGYGIFVLIGWMLVFGESLFGVRMLMVLAGLITAWVYYLISKKWWGNHEAGIAALVFGIVSTSSFYTLVGVLQFIATAAYRGCTPGKEMAAFFGRGRSNPDH